jgi:hypothetical protein
MTKVLFALSAALILAGGPAFADARAGSARALPTPAGSPPTVVVPRSVYVMQPEVQNLGDLDTVYDCASCLRDLLTFDPGATDCEDCGSAAWGAGRVIYNDIVDDSERESGSDSDSDSDSDPEDGRDPTASPIFFFQLP